MRLPPETLNAAPGLFLAFGRKAYDAFVLDVEEGDARPFARLMRPDCGWFVPVPFQEWRGRQVGGEAYERFSAWRASHIRMRAKMELLCETIGGPDGRTVGYEWRIAGTVSEQPFETVLSIFFDFDDDGRITEWREYVIDPLAMADATHV